MKLQCLDLKLGLEENHDCVWYGDCLCSMENHSTSSTLVQSGESTNVKWFG
jgi:hypothetical protein